MRRVCRERKDVTRVRRRECKVLEWDPRWLEQIFRNLGMMVKERVSISLLIYRACCWRTVWLMTQYFLITP